ncbi:hypothetical protein QZN01_20805 [Burkholderia cenocepacia]|uniref:hypothetical protein n=1 Tax=Burkholderia cenocepacia TaxID=95486 RepID=UPI00264D99F8|nr:hypothetical protein [Burkholderia cenocepacia]MDN7825096.1 hypothetical protein [Burkholderia cenocepacia]
MTQPNFKAVIPPPDTPLLGPNGKMADVWWRIISILIQRTGGVSGGDGQLTLADVLALEETIAPLLFADGQDRRTDMVVAPTSVAPRIADVIAAPLAITPRVSEIIQPPLPTATRIAEMIFAPNYAGLGSAAYRDVSYFLQAANNLSDLASASTARTNLGLGTFATQNYATPPALGQTTPNLAAFTYLTLNSGTTAQADLQITNNLANGPQIKMTEGASSTSNTLRIHGGVLQVMNNGYSAVFQLDGSGNLTVNGGLTMSPATTTTAPAAGGAGALPATPAGYATVTIGGTARKIAYY